MKKILIFLLILLIILTTFSGCRNEEEQEMIISLDKMHYAFSMRFVTRIAVDGEVSNSDTVVINHVIPNFPDFTTFYTELVFVHSEEEAERFPDNVIVAWPGELTPYILSGFQWAIERSAEDLFFNGRQQREVTNLADFGLASPLTVADLVDNWEQVDALRQSFTSSERSVIRGDAERAADAAWRNR